MNSLFGEMSFHKECSGETETKESGKSCSGLTSRAQIQAAAVEHCERNCFVVNFQVQFLGLGSTLSVIDFMFPSGLKYHCRIVVGSSEQTLV